MRVRIPLFLRWWICWFIFFFGDIVLTSFFGIEAGTASIAVKIGAVILFILLTIINWYFGRGPTRVPERQRLPRMPRPEIPSPPPIPRHLRRPLELQELALIEATPMGGDITWRTGTIVRPTARGIRPLAILEVNDDRLVGKKARLRFRLFGPWSLRPVKVFEEDIVFQLGLNKVFPKRSEYPIAGHRRRQGTWYLALDLLGKDYEKQWEEITFRLAKEVPVEELIGEDAELKPDAIEKVATSEPKVSLEELLRDVK